MTTHLARLRRTLASLLSVLLLASGLALLPAALVSPSTAAVAGSAESARASCGELREQRDQARARRAAEASDVRQARYALDAERNRYDRNPTAENRQRVKNASARLQNERAQLRRATKIAKQATARYNRRCT